MKNKKEHFRSWCAWKPYLERELYIWISRSSRGKEKKMIFCWTGSGMRLYFSSTFWNGSFSATILAEISSKESGVFLCDPLEFCPWLEFRFVKSSLIVNVSWLLVSSRIFTRTQDKFFLTTQFVCCVFENSAMELPFVKYFDNLNHFDSWWNNEDWIKTHTTNRT